MWAHLDLKYFRHGSNPFKTTANLIWSLKMKTFLGRFCVNMTYGGPKPDKPKVPWQFIMSKHKWTLQSFLFSLRLTLQKSLRANLTQRFCITLTYNLRMSFMSWNGAITTFTSHSSHQAVTRCRVILSVNYSLPFHLYLSPEILSQSSNKGAPLSPLRWIL